MEHSIYLDWTSNFADCNRDKLTYPRLIQGSSKQVFLPKPSNIGATLQLGHEIEETHERVKNILLRRFSNILTHKLSKFKSPSQFREVDKQLSVDGISMTGDGRKSYFN